MPKFRKEPLRVLMVMTSMNRGGMETFTMNMYRQINRELLQFDFLLHRDFKGDYDEEIESLGGKIYRIRRQNPFDPFYWHDLNSFFASNPYKIVHAQLDCLSAEPLAAAKKQGVGVRIAHSHNSRQDKDLKYPLKMLCKPFIKRYATDLFACGEAAGRWMFGTDDFTVIKNAIDVSKYAFDENARLATREVLGIKPDSLVIGHVGRFQPVKNHDYIVRVFNALLKHEPDAILLLVGQGETIEPIRGLVESLGIKSSVRFLGVRSDVSNLMKAMDAFIMPSFFEGLPLVLVEAQSSGLPCVISDTIPFDCDIDEGLIKRMSLDDSVDSWAIRLCESASSETDRSLGSSIVRNAGFDVVDEAARLQAFYLKKAGESK